MNTTVTVGWWQSFSRRNKELALRCAEPLSTSRAKVNVETLEKYFTLLEECLSENELIDKPCQIFNCNETGMPLNPNMPKVVVKRGTKHSQAFVHQLSHK